MNKSIKDMLAELKENNLIETATGYDDYCEYYKGLRTNAINIVGTRSEFLDNKLNGLLIAEGKHIFDENVKAAYGLMTMQKLCSNHII